jgi:hypothetical protein
MFVRQNTENDLFMDKASGFQPRQAKVGKNRQFDSQRAICSVEPMAQLYTYPATQSPALWRFWKVRVVLGKLVF